MNQDFIRLAILEVMPAALATGLFVSLATFQAPSGVFDDAGAANGNYADVAGLTNIPCTAPPPSDARIQATENRALAEISASEWHHVLLNAFYPSLDQGWRGDGTPTGAWRVIIGGNDGNGNLIDGFAYDIAGIESDSQSQMTRMTAKLTTI